MSHSATFRNGITERGHWPADERRLALATDLLADGRQVLIVKGEIDMETAPAFALALNDALSRSGRVIVDLTRCGFLDSTALNVLVTASTHLNGAGPLSLIIPDGHVLQVFQMTHLDRVFAIHPTRAAALSGRRRACHPNGQMEHQAEDTVPSAWTASPRE